jgi:hypothetical protein
VIASEKIDVLSDSPEEPDSRRPVRHSDKYDLEETLQALEDRFGEQHFAAAYRCQSTTRTQKAGESSQDFATAIEQLAHRAYPTLPDDHIRREAGRAFAWGVKDPDIKIQPLLEGEKRVNEALR